LLPLTPLDPPSPLGLAARGEGGLKRGFAAGGEAARRKTPSFIPLPSPAVRERGGARGGVRAPAAGERERGTNDSEIFMNLGARGGVRAAAREALPRDRVTVCRNNLSSCNSRV